MKQLKQYAAIAVLCGAAVGSASACKSGGSQGAKVAASLNGLEIPADYRDWRVISVSHRTDKNSMRVIVGNDVAVDAARNGRTQPWPDGAILGKIAWAEGAEKNWPSAISAQRFSQVEFMFKDSKRWADTGGWGFARWVGTDLAPYGKDPTFTAECVGCHTPVRDRDWVYTSPASMLFPPALPGP